MPPTGVFMRCNSRRNGRKAPGAALRIENSSNLLFANTLFYRVVSCYVPHPHAISVSDSKDIRFRNTHLYSNSKVSFDATVFDPGTGVEVRDPDFAVLDAPGEPATIRKESIESVVAPGARVEKLADGFLNISGAAADARGNVYFADPRELQIYRWSVAQRRSNRFARCLNARSNWPLIRRATC